MRYRIVVVLLGLAVVGPAAESVAELSMGSGTLIANQSVVLNVNLKSAGKALTGIQFDINYDAAVFDVSLENGPAAEQAGKSLQSASLEAGTQRALIVGLNQNSLSDGVVAILRVSPKGKAEAGRRYAIGMTALAGTNSRGKSVAVSGHGGVIAVAKREE